jgi:hypothetical protein
MANPNPTYSFKDVQCAIAGPGGSFTISEGGVADEGITITMENDKGTLVHGADGSWMHSLHASDGGTVTLRLLKTSPMNALLDRMYRFDTTSSANFGLNIISVRNPMTGDSITCQGAAFSKHPDFGAAKEGGTTEWSFKCGRIDTVLGNGAPAI